MYYKYMYGELEEKSLKLLADPTKLKIKRNNVFADGFKYQMECKFNCDITDRTYQHLLRVIKTELIISSIVETIIDDAVNRL